MLEQILVGEVMQLRRDLLWTPDLSVMLSDQ
jgi:hypothetical protein